MQHQTGTALPTMALSTIKKDENGQPKCCKYRIVVLGNLDNHDWSKTDCFAPVLSSQPELQLLIDVAIGHKCIPKTGNVSQAFCQSVLPPNESMCFVHLQDAHKHPKTHTGASFKHSMVLNDHLVIGTKRHDRYLNLRD